MNATYDLVEWVNKSTSFVQPWDRPWTYIKSPTAIEKDGALILTLQYRCLCQKANITLCHHLCDNKSHLYLGQCQRCQKILWTTHP